MDAFNSVVRDHPGAIVLILTGLLAASKATAATVFWFGKRELARVWTEHAEHEERIVQLEEGDSAHELILQRLDHMQGILNEVKTDVKGHNVEAEKWKRDIVGHGVRIGNLEAKR